MYIKIYTMFLFVVLILSMYPYCIRSLNKLDILNFIQTETKFLIQNLILVLSQLLYLNSLFEAIKFKIQNLA